MRFQATLLFSIVGGATIAQPKPNVIIYIADDMGYEDSGPYGNTNIFTPNIDQFSKLAMRFDNAFLSASSSSPSRCSILTSLYPHNTGACRLGDPLPADKQMLSQALRNVGYTTASIGKWHQGDEVKPQFDFIDIVGENAFGPHCVDYLKNRDKKKPFFLWAASRDPHRPYKASTPNHNKAEKLIVPPYLPDTEDIRTDLCAYYDEISRFDEHLGMLIRELTDQKLMDNTIIVVMSDNGKPFPYCKTRCTIPGMKTPLLIYYKPLIHPGSTTKALVNSIDIAPTILEIVGGSFAKEVQGKSFMNVLKKPTSKARDYAFAEHNFHDYTAFERAIYDERYALIHNFVPQLNASPPADVVRSITYAKMLEMQDRGVLGSLFQDCFIVPRSEFELYDYILDPHCLNNLIGNPKYVGIEKKLAKKLEDWRKSTNDVFPGIENLTPDRFDRRTGKSLTQP